MRITKLVDYISLEQDSREYNLAEGLINSDDSDMSDCPNLGDLPIQLPTKIIAKVAVREAACLIKIKNFNNLSKLYTPYVGSKST